MGIQTTMVKKGLSVKEDIHSELFIQHVRQLFRDPFSRELMRLIIMMGFPFAALEGKFY